MIDKSRKTRINLTIEHDLKAKVEELAKEDERSTNSMIIKLLREALQERGEWSILLPFYTIKWCNFALIYINLVSFIDA